MTKLSLDRRAMALIYDTGWTVERSEVTQALDGQYYRVSLDLRRLAGRQVSACLRALSVELRLGVSPGRKDRVAHLSDFHGELAASMPALESALTKTTCEVCA